MIHDNAAESAQFGAWKERGKKGTLSGQREVKFGDRRENGVRERNVGECEGTTRRAIRKKEKTYVSFFEFAYLQKNKSQNKNNAGKKMIKFQRRIREKNLKTRSTRFKFEFFIKKNRFYEKKNHEIYFRRGYFIFPNRKVMKLFHDRLQS